MLHLHNDDGPKHPTLEEIKRQVVLERLDHFNGNKTRAASSLGITIKTIYNWLNNWDQKGLYR